MPSVDPQRVRRKVAWRILPLLLLLYIIAYLDRVNVSYAKLQMQTVLEFPDDVFGWGFGIFFFGYLLLEIPGALLVEHWSARKWFARILVTWGACSMAMAFVRTPGQFYLGRFLLGLAEAGFFPGVIIYFTHWFPRADRARALATLVLGVPFSQAFGAAFSSWLMANHWLGFDGWQWVFLLEGAPAVLFGLALPWIMTDRPRQARWLTPEERDWLEQTLEAERREIAQYGGMHLRQALREPTVWLLALAILLTNTGGYGMTFWLPSVVKNLLASMAVPATESAVLRWTSVVYLCGLAGVWLSGQSSDRTGERKWHCVGGQVATGVCLLMATVPGQSWGQVFGWFCLVGFFAVWWPSPFWVLPTQALSASAAAVSIGFINICANVAGLIGPPLVGELKARGHGERMCLVVLGCCYLAGGAVVSLLRVRRGSAELVSSTKAHDSTLTQRP